MYAKGQPTASTTRRIRPFCLLLLAVLLPLTGASAQALDGPSPDGVHGGEARVWRIGPGEKTQTIRVDTGLMPGSGEAGTLRRATSLRGRVAAAAAGPGGRSLWLVLGGGAVQELAVASSSSGGRFVPRVNIRPAAELPAGERARALLAVDGGLWVLTQRTDEGEAAHSIEPAAEVDPPAAETDQPAADADQPAVETDQPAADADQPAVETDQPEAETNKPEAETNKPEAETNKPEAETNKPEAETNKPEAETNKPEAPQRSRALQLRMLSVGERAGADEPETEPAGPTPPASLLFLGRRGWERHGVPAAAEARDGAAWLLPSAGADAAGRPAILLRGAGGSLRLQEPVTVGVDADAWAARDLGTSPPLAAAPIPIEGGAVLLFGDVENGSRSAEILRPASAEPRIPLPATAAALTESDAIRGSFGGNGRWWIAREAEPPAADEAVPAWLRWAAEAPAEEGLSLTPVALDGTPGTARRVGISRNPAGGIAADFPLLLLVLMVATMATFLFWRRDPKKQELRLKPEQRLASTGIRLAAAAIDLAPGLLLAWLVFGSTPEALFAHWPGLGRPSTPLQTLPPLLVVVVTTLHTGLAEAMTGRSLGKLLLRLRVADLAGRRVSFGRGVLRMAMKPVDLLAVLLLVLPLINPHRQRLCDLVAGTVVLGAEEAEAEADA